jgi:hypothetical protein
MERKVQKRMLAMSGEATITQKLNNLKPIYCTATKKQVVAEVQQEFIIPNGLATWLHCEACRGWHVVIDRISNDYAQNSSGQSLEVII